MLRAVLLGLTLIVAVPVVRAEPAMVPEDDPPAAAAEVAVPPPAPVAQPVPTPAAPAPEVLDQPSGRDPLARGQRRGKGSGFWTSDVPADDNPYRWKHMAVGGAVGLLMLLLILYLVRKHARRPA